MPRLILILVVLSFASPSSMAANCAKGYASTNSKSKFSDEVLLHALISLGSSRQPMLLDVNVRKVLAAMAGVKGDKALLEARNQKKILTALQNRMDADYFEEVVGANAATLKNVLHVPEEHADDLKDLNRGWGFLLLPSDDKAFKDKKFLTAMVRSQRADGDVMNLRLLGGEDARSAFNAAWAAIAPKGVEVRRLTLTGTDANNSLYEIAESVVKDRLYRQWQARPGFRFRNFFESANDGTTRSVRDVIRDRVNAEMRAMPAAEILAFDGAYAGGAGRIQKLSFRANNQNEHLLIESPHTTHWNPTDAAEIRRLDGLEARALAAMEKRFRSSDPPIGGFLLEPILGAKGVYFYRRDFLMKVRALCDKYEVPIFADEILTGGGRTGKFFAYQHYAGFEPDFVTFGKGLQVAGVAQVNRTTGQTLAEVPYAEVTLRGYSEAMLKSTQVMNRIREDKLMERAADTGAYFARKIREKARAEIREKMKMVEGNMDSWAVRDREELQKELRALDGPDGVRNAGALIWAGDYSADYDSAMGRLLPPLTLTKKDVDKIVKEASPYR